MPRARPRCTKLFAIVMLGVALHSSAQQESDDSIAGRVRFGFRGVDVSGAEGKYRQHVNLDSGPRLFELSFEYQPVGTFGKAVDWMSFDMRNFGGDPFQNLRFDLRKFGTYNFQYRHSKSVFFHEDILFPGEYEDQRLHLEGDFTTFDVDRVRDSARFDVTLSKAARLNIGFNSFTRKGDSTSKLRVARIVTPVARPIDERSSDFNVGLEYRWQKAAFIFQERIRSFDNATEMFLPGASDRDPDTTVLTFFRSQPYDLRSFQHTFRLNLTPDPRWLIRASASIETMDLDAKISESFSSISDGEISMGAADGGGTIARDTSWIDIDASYLVNERLSFVFGLWRDDLDQKGDYTFGSSENRGQWDMGTTGVEGGLQYALSTGLNVSGGLRHESRNVDYGKAENDEPIPRARDTSQTGLFLGAGWVHGTILDINAELETGKVNDPFALASPTDRLRLRAQAKLNRANGVYGTLTFTAHRFTNDDRPPDPLVPSNWESDRDHINGRAGYRSSVLDVSAGYAFARIRQEVEQTINPGDGPFLIPVLYRADSNFVDGRLRWQLAPKWLVGADVRLYDNAGSFAVRRNDLRSYVEATLFDSYIVNIGYRRIDFEEKVFGFNDYEANIMEGSIGYSW